MEINGAGSIKREVFAQQLIAFNKRTIIANTISMGVTSFFAFLIAIGENWVGAFFLGLSGAAMSFGVLMIRVQRQAEKQYDGLQFLQEEQQVQLDKQKLRRQAVNGNQCWKWEEIHQVIEAKECFQFHLIGGQFIPVPQHFFGEGEQLARVYDLLNHQFTKRKEGRWKNN
ncbi:YcxB family protein [Marinococcus sp. PL1-022]|uniref:YcxB family protein n=1 Tax=Marinococcus sp. PL1-022 TaxID=3095363 RepID=UPI0029C31FB5|nr:YcxB family protein [Marinococcus sp. PL1-022]MDX6152674.1 YcxB family protein [Marinococcus sp. PL1-022]